MKKLFLCLCILSVALSVKAQLPVFIHSHNDYWRTMPFYEAYSQYAQSIEADVYLLNGELLVGHDTDESTPDKKFVTMYMEPIVKLFRANGGHMWKDSDAPMQLMVEAKNDNVALLNELVRNLEKYPDVFCSENGVRVVITGYDLKPDEFSLFPKWMYFDGGLSKNYTPEQLERVALFSECFEDYAHWNGKGNILDSQLEALKKAIDKAHALNKPIRFWGAPETTTAYYTFYNLGIDFFNTDHPAQAYQFFRDFANKNFSMGKPSQAKEGVTGTNKLDRATRDFKGFQNENLQLSHGIEVYQPTHLNDGAEKPIKNVILLIGDGMGFNQVIAGAYANGRKLNVLNMKYTGFSFTNSLHDFTTDSAAGGSALGTGVTHKNRHLSAQPDGTPVPSLSNWFHARGKAAGSVSLGDMADATPVVFYAHTTERDSIESITRQITNGEADLIAGSGSDRFLKPREDGFDMLKALKESGYTFVTKCEDINAQKGKVVCADDRMGAGATEETLDFLAKLTRESITKLTELNDKGFFLMVEGPKIDYAGHSECLPASVIEQLGFDMAVAEALKFADSNGETLVVVTADHDTGGLVLLDGDLAENRIMGIYTTNDHTPAVVPVFAYGPGAQKFIGSHINIDVCNLIKELTK
ncbi:MAG: alkaline phosphatase [Bacteroidaceae bacterium]|nr:alkaline phosphatase [Bacteroidaceae bacterium]